MAFRIITADERLSAAENKTSLAIFGPPGVGKTSGTVRIEDAGVVVIADLPKKVTWDQDRLAAMAARIADSGDDPTEYLEIAYRVPERRFSAWPEAMREGFASARSESTGKPVFRLETRDR